VGERNGAIPDEVLEKLRNVIRRLALETRAEVEYLNEHFLNWLRAPKWPQDYPVLESYCVQMFDLAAEYLLPALSAAGDEQTANPRALARLDAEIDGLLEVADVCLASVEIPTRRERFHRDLALVLESRRAYWSRRAADWQLEQARRATTTVPADGSKQRDDAHREPALQSQPQPADVVAHDNVFRRRPDGQWDLAFEGQRATLPDLRGLSIIQMLLRNPGVPISAEKLIGKEIISAIDPAMISDTRGGEDEYIEGSPHRVSEEAVDDRAMREYDAEVVRLQRRAEDADVVGDKAEYARCLEEIKTIQAYRRAQHGLRGPRRIDVEGDRSRQSARKNYVTAEGRIRELLPELAEHLRRSISTGSTLVYDPASDTVWRT